MAVDEQAVAQDLIDHHNSIVRRGSARALELEDRMTRLLIPVFDRAADEAADNFLRLAEMTTVTAATPGVTATSTMVCVTPTPEQAASLAQDGGEDADNIHCTLVFLGDYGDALSSLQEALQQVAASHAPLSGSVGGLGSFADNGDGAPRIALPDVPGLVELRVAVTQALAERGIEFARTHGFTPHITLGYDTGEPPDDLLGQSLDFGDLMIVRGNDERVALPLTGAKPVTASVRGPDSEWPHGLVCMDCGCPIEEGDEYLTRQIEDDVSEIICPICALTAAADPPAGAPPTWTQPPSSLLVDVDKLVAELGAVINPVREKVALVVMKTAVETAPLPAQEPSSPPPAADVVNIAAAPRKREGAAPRSGIRFDLNNPAAQVAARASSTQITNIAETTRQKVARTIAKSYTSGLSIRETANDLRTTMKSLSESRARTIARTELAGAVNGGSLASTQILDEAAGGLGINKVWMTSPGAAFPRHETYDGLDGQTVGLFDAFDVGGEDLQFPGDPAGSPEEVCNCRCAISYAKAGQIIAQEDAESAVDPETIAAEAEGGGNEGVEADAVAAQVVEEAAAVPEAVIESPIVAQDMAKRASILPEPTDERPFGHLKDTGLDRRVEGTRRRMRAMLAKPEKMSALDKLQYGKLEDRLKAALRERELRKEAIPKRPYAHISDTQLGRLKERTETQLKASRKKADKLKAQTTLDAVNQELALRKKAMTAFPSRGRIQRGEVKPPKEKAAKRKTAQRTTRPKPKRVPPTARPEPALPAIPNTVAARRGVIPSRGKDVKITVQRRTTGRGWELKGSYVDRQGRPHRWTSQTPLRNQAAAERAAGLHRLGYSPVAQQEFVLTRLPNTIDEIALQGRDLGYFDPARDSEQDVLLILRRARQEGAVVQDGDLWRPMPARDILPESKRPPYQPPVPPKNGRMKRLQDGYAARYADYRDTKEYGTIVVGGAPRPDLDVVRAFGNDFRNEVESRLRSRKAVKFSGTAAEREAQSARYEAQSERDTILQVLSEIRPLAGTDSLANISANSDAAGAAMLRNATSVYPADWNMLLGETRLDVSRVAGRSGVTYYEDTNRFTIGLNTGRQGRAVYQRYLSERASIHELAHVFEEVVPGISDVQRAFYVERTNGEMLKWDPVEGAWYREDEFVTKYMGRDYYTVSEGSVRMPPAPDPRTGAGGATVFELLSVAMEAMMTGSYSLLLDDPEAANVFLGILATL